MGKQRWKTAVEILVPVLNGPWDGADILMTDLEPGQVVTLRGSRYVTQWRNGQPHLQYEG